MGQWIYSWVRNVSQEKNSGEGGPQKSHGTADAMTSAFAFKEISDQTTCPLSYSTSELVHQKQDNAQIDKIMLTDDRFLIEVVE